MAQTGSFIPKQSKVSRSRPKTRQIYVFSYVSYVVFFGTLLIVAAMFVYELRLQSSLENQKLLLASEREAFSQSDIERVRELEQRIVIAERLLDRHVATSRVFTALEQSIVRSVQVTSIELIKEVGGVYRLAVGGIAPNFDSLLFQREILNNPGLLASAQIDEVAFGNRETSEVEDEPIAAISGITFTISDTLAVSDLAYVLEPVSSDPALSTPADTTELRTEESVVDPADVVSFDEPEVIDEGTVATGTEPLSNDNETSL